MFRNAAYAAAGGPASRPCQRGFDIETAWRAMTSHRHGHGPQHGRGPRGGAGPGWPGGGFGPRGGFGFGGPGGFPFGPGGPSFRRGPKARRGDVRAAALLLLAEEPRNGYQIMQELEERSGGAWRPSPGSVYPALQQLEDEGLIRSEETDGRKLFQLTDAGRTAVDERDDGQPAPWDQMAGDVSDEAWAIMGVMREVGMALFQVMQSGSEAQRAQARRVLTATRRDLYRILADGDDPDDTPPDAGGAAA
jgi:DNA-binding PadR family transcriptional regulator